MPSAVEKLMYKIGMIDNLSKPAKRVSQTFDKMQRHAAKGAQQLAIGTAAMGAAVLTAGKLIGPAVEMEKAMGTVASLDTPAEELAKLENAATSFAMKYGGSAMDIVASSYDIQSAIEGLDMGELAAFTTSSALLAKATKADAATITNYVGTMYGIFSENAEEMGKAAWVDQLTGQTAQAVKMFKTTGTDMAQAFENVGGAGVALGISAGEQIAVVGQLQASMKGAVAGTAFRAYLTGLGKLQASTKIKVEDQTGKLLPQAEIIERISKATAGMSGTQKQNLLMRAFGSVEAVKVFQALEKNTDGLAANIERLEGITGLGPAEKMAQAMTHTTDRLKAGLGVLFLTLSQGAYKALKPFLEASVAIVGKTVEWLQANPRLTKVIGVATVATLGLVAAFGALLILMGSAHLIYAGVMAFVALAGVLKGTTIATWLLNIAMYANPIGLVIAGIVAFIAVMAAGIVMIKKGAGWVKILGYVALASLGPIGIALALVITYWDKFAAAAEWAGTVISAYYSMLWRIFSRIATAIIEMIVPMEVLSGWWASFSATAMEAFQTLRIIGGDVLEWLGGAVKSIFTGLVGWIKQALELASKIPGIGKAARIALEEIGTFEMTVGGGPGETAAPKQLDVPPGGLRQSFNQSKSTTYGDVHITSRNAPGPAELEEWMSLSYG